MRIDYDYSVGDCVKDIEDFMLKVDKTLRIYGVIVLFVTTVVTVGLNLWVLMDVHIVVVMNMIWYSLIGEHDVYHVLHQRWWWTNSW